jgi:hypothetical protein
VRCVLLDRNWASLFSRLIYGHSMKALARSSSETDLINISNGYRGNSLPWLA